MIPWTVYKKLMNDALVKEKLISKGELVGLRQSLQRGKNLHVRER